MQRSLRALKKSLPTHKKKLTQEHTQAQHTKQSKVKRYADLYIVKTELLTQTQSHGHGTEGFT